MEQSVIDGLDKLIEDAAGKRDEAERELAALTTAKVTLGGEPAAERQPAKARRRRKGTTRKEQVEALVREQPGIGAAVAAAQLKVSPGGIYNVLRELKDEGVLKKDGPRYYPNPTAVAA